MSSQNASARRNALPWERAVRHQLRAAVGPGFLLRQQSGAAQLTVRYSDGSRRSCQLGVPWHPAHGPAIVQAAIDAAALVRGGAAPARAVRQSKLLRSTRVDWAALGQLYRKHRLGVLADLSPISWRKKFMPVLTGLVQADPADATSAMAAAAVGEPGSRGRAIRLHGTAALLKWAVEEGHLPATWQPPDGKRWLGRRPQRAKRPAPPDDQLLAVVGAQEGPAWLAAATMLLGGLRPWELRHVQARDGCLFVPKGKTHSGGTTAARMVALLPPEGCPAGWPAAVLAGVQAGGLPNLGDNDNRVQSRLIQLLHRRGWPREVNLYSLRHAYGRRAGNVYGLPVRHAAALMGHSVKTHLGYYGATDNDAAVQAAMAATAPRAVGRMDVSRHLV